MNIYYDNFDRSSRKRSSQGARALETICAFLFAIYTLARSEVFALCARTFLALGAVGALAVIVNAVRVGVLNFIPAAIIAFLLLGFVALCFKSCED